MTLGVLLARQRSGTGALGSVLDQQPSLKYLGEVFHNDSVSKSPNYFWFLQRLAKENPAAVLPGEAEARWQAYGAYLQGEHPGKTVIVDIKYRSTHHLNGYWHGVLEAPTMFRLLAKQRVPIIHLTRRNFLKTYISGRLAEMNTVWHAQSLDEISRRTIRVDIPALMGFLNATHLEQERIFHFLRSYPRVATLEYAETFDEVGNLTNQAVAQLSAFFELDNFGVRRPAFVKQTSDDLAEVVENYAEVRAALAVTPHGWMLNGA